MNQNYIVTRKNLKTGDLTLNIKNKKIKIKFFPNVMKEEVHPTHGLSFFFVFLKDALTEISQRSNTDLNVSTTLNHIYLQIPSRASTVGPRSKVLQLEGVLAGR